MCDVRTVSWAMSDLGVNKIDLLKVDVEGSELVRGWSSLTPASHPRVKHATMP